jgi:asparagine synthase (glutamine-hydrolysing)
VLPKEIIYRKKKGFGVPLARWLKDWDEPQLALRSPEADMAWVRRKWQEHRTGKADHRLFLWCWIVLQCHLRGAQGPHVRGRADQSGPGLVDRSGG